MSSSTSTKPRAASAPWWLHGGDEQCPHCGQAYFQETQLRCEACDAPGCMHCLAVTRTLRLCPECTATGDDES